MIKVYSKIELSKELQKKVVDVIKKQNHEVTSEELENIEYIIDKNIISGIKIDVNSEVIDLTANNRLEKILGILN